VRKFLEFLLISFMRVALWFRYRIVVKGAEKLNPKVLNKPGGVLFLPNHPAAIVDPLAVGLSVWNKYPIRPMIVEYMYYTPFIHPMMKFLNALPVPDFTTSSNSLKRKKSEEVVQEVIKDLRRGQNFLVYPSGKLKNSEIEDIGGASAVHRLIHEVPEANVVFVRVKGLWGSSFSRYYMGRTPPVFPTIWQGIKYCFKNLLFFTPRREIIVEFEPAPADFPYKASRLEMNRYLEKWYNKPDGLTPQKGDEPGDSLILVSYSMWGEKYPEVTKKPLDESAINLDTIPEDIKKKVYKKIAEMKDVDPSTIKPELNLATDLAMDSLDIAELAIYLQDTFDVQSIPVIQLTSVAKVLGIASKQIVFQEDTHEEETDVSQWKQPVKKTRLTVADGETVPEVFLRNCKRMGKAVACGDMRSGVLTYPQLKTRAILLAEYIRHLPGEYIGILLPASVGATLLVFATQLAGKTPLMINWTVGPRHLESVIKLSNVQVVLSSWAFLDRVENVELNGLESMLLMVEDIRRELSIFDKVRAAYRSKLSIKSILKTFGTDKLTKNDPAVLLFTSGTESMPKGVPLTHNNILTNLRSVFEFVELYSDDVLFGILPPFHSFGFAMSTVFGPLSGLKMANSPDPTDGRRLANGVEKWGVTVVCGAPLFLKSMLKAAKPDQLKTLRICVTGAEKAPPELFQMMASIGKEEALIEGYGITECSPVITANPIYGKHKGVGKAVPNVEVIIVHQETFEDVPLNVQGLILTRGPNVFSGYINKDISSPFVEHRNKQWYKTGDLGSLDEDGFLTISGRLKRFIKIGGEMVSLAAIEDALLKSVTKEVRPTADEGPVLAICAKEIPGDKPKIFLFTRFNTQLDEVNRSLKESGFSNLVRITSITPLEEIPVMGTGKINYRALESKYVH